MKKIIYIILITSVIIISITFILKQLNRPVIYKGLSERAQEYLSQNKTKSSEPWGNFNISTQDAKSNAGMKETNECFSIIIPFEVRKNKDQGPCNRYITFNHPLGEITVYQMTAPTPLDENPSVTMRRSNNSLYNEGSEEINGKKYITFKENGTNYKKIAFTQVDEELFILNINVYADDRLDKTFSQMLSSVIYK